MRGGLGLTRAATAPIMAAMEPLVHIDGSYGEGGGQILRTSLTLSALLQIPFEAHSIRAGRKNPGLMAQHLTSVRATAKASQARVDGDQFRSTKLRFEPHGVVSGRYGFDVALERGSAGSVGLIFQTIVPVLLYGDSLSEVEIEGGTHVPFSPPYHYIAEVFVPTLKKMGVHVKASIDRWGFYPLGGGKIVVNVEPAPEVLPLWVSERGSLRRVSGISAVANLPASIAERQRERAMSRLRERGVQGDIGIVNAPSPGAGSFLFLLAEYEHAVSGFSSLGARGKPAERVADEAVEEFLVHNERNAVFDKHLADQLIVYCALANGESRFTTSEVSNHLLTNKWVVEQFLPAKISVNGTLGQWGEIQIFGGKHGEKV